MRRLLQMHQGTLKRAEAFADLLVRLYDFFATVSGNSIRFVSPANRDICFNFESMLRTT